MPSPAKDNGIFFVFYSFYIIFILSASFFILFFIFLYYILKPYSAAAAATAKRIVIVVAATEKDDKGNNDNPRCAVIKKIAKTVHLVASFRKLKALCLWYYFMQNTNQCDCAFPSDPNEH